MLTVWGFSLVKDTVVKDSQISGKGILAVCTFIKGALVIRWSSYKTLTKQEMEHLPEREKEHVSFIDGAYVVVPPESRVNHSCDPNVYLKNYCYYAKRDVEVGEEITADYRLESDAGFMMKCNCGSKNCKGYISVP
jgi:SET domain-containing protein